LPNLKEQVRNEGFCLLALCRDLSEFISSGRTRKTYLHQTNDFLEKYIIRSLKSIEKAVGEAVEQQIDEELLKSKLREFELIKKALSSLYVLTKETIDSDTLSIPYSLTMLLNDMAKKIEELDSVGLVVLGSSDLMYYKYNLERLRNLTRNLGFVIKDYPMLPEDIGILKFPYCAAHDVLVNCILFHEMGHYIYERTKLEESFLRKIEEELAEFVINEKMLKKLKPIQPRVAWNRLSIYVRGLMAAWTDEIFADIFAVRILGPAFHLACLQMENILPTNIEGDKDFSRTHPADNFRFKIHAEWLKEGKWNSVIAKRTPEISKQLKDCKKLKIEDFKIKCQPPLEGKKNLEEKLHKWMLGKFEEMVLEIEKVVTGKVAKVERPISDFAKNDHLVTKYLEHGVVPSTVCDEQKNKYHPNPTTILNSGFFFYLSGMKKLIEKIQAKVSQPEKRLKYEKRLNGWLAKAIEDWRILQMGNNL
jgi:hypothetical protein